MPKDQEVTMANMGTIDNPFKLPNAKRPKQGIDIIDQFPTELRDLMDDRLKESIRSIPTIKDSLVLNEAGEYVLSPDKSKQGSYDDFMKTLTLQHGIDARFKGGPKVLNHSLRGKLEAGQEYLFGLIKDGDTTKILVLPRDEVIEIDGKFFMGRHTHREFLLGKEGASLLAAGTMHADQHSLKFNFRTGHFNVHKDDPRKLAKIRVEMADAISFANDKTLPNKKPTYRQLSTSTLEYEIEHKASHSVMDELSGSTYKLSLSSFASSYGSSYCQNPSPTSRTASLPVARAQ